jgi:hypothetical protein
MLFFFSFLSGNVSTALLTLLPKSIGTWDFKLSETRRGLRWQAAGLGKIPETAHKKCFMPCDVNGDDNQIAQGELLCITRIMHRFLSTITYLDFMNIPVCGSPPFRFAGTDSY